MQPTYYVGFMRKNQLSDLSDTKDVNQLISTALLCRNELHDINAVIFEIIGKDVQNSTVTYYLMAGIACYDLKQQTPVIQSGPENPFPVLIQLSKDENENFYVTEYRQYDPLKGQTDSQFIEDNFPLYLHSKAQRNRKNPSDPHPLLEYFYEKAIPKYFKQLALDP